MSYSFTVRAGTKSEAKEEVAAKLEEVVQGQPAHAADRPHAQAAADAFIDLLSDDDGKDLVVCVSGYLSGQWQGTDLVSLSAASVSVSASLAERASRF